MSQKLTNDQLREAYFKNHTTLKPFSVRQDSTYEHQKSQVKSENKKMSYEKFSDNEINRFGNLFNTFVNSDPKTPIISMDNTIQDFEFEPEPPVAETKPTHYHGSYHDLFNLSEHEEPKPVVSGAPSTQVSRLETDLRAKMQAQEELIREMKAQLELTELLATEINSQAPTEYVLTDEDDLYLENLVNGNGYGVAAPSSLADIFAEITNNEKDSVSNYESSIFDANVEQLFSEGEDIDKFPSITLPTIPAPTPVLDTPITELTPFPELSFTNTPAPILELPELPNLNFDSPLEPIPNFDLPPIPDLNTSPMVSNIDLPILPEVNLEPQPPVFELPPMPELNLQPELPNIDLPILPEVNLEPQPPVFELPPMPELNLQPELPNIELPIAPTFELESLMPEFDLPPLPGATSEATIPDFDLPPLPELDFLNGPEPTKPVITKTKKNSDALDASEQKKKRQEKTLKLKILDGLLIFVLLAIVSVLVFHFVYPS